MSSELHPPAARMKRTKTEMPGNLVEWKRVCTLDMMEMMEGFSWANLGLNLIPGGILWVIQAVVRRWPPGDEPNALYGYRTKRSMASPQAWVYANRRSIDLYAFYSWPLMAAAVPFTLYTSIDTAQLVLYSAMTVACVWPLVVIERALKRGEHLAEQDG